MDTKNIIAAISLSAAVIIIYGLFFAPDPQQIKQKQIQLENNATGQNSETPKIELKEETVKIEKITDDIFQIHGGYGYINEYEVERFFRDAKILEIGEGTSEIQRIIISREILKSVENIS